MHVLDAAGVEIVAVFQHFVERLLDDGFADVLVGRPVNFFDGGRFAFVVAGGLRGREHEDGAFLHENILSSRAIFFFHARLPAPVSAGQAIRVGFGHLDGGDEIEFVTAGDVGQAAITDRLAMADGGVQGEGERGVVCHQVGVAIAPEFEDQDHVLGGYGLLHRGAVRQGLAQQRVPISPAAWLQDGPQPRAGHDLQHISLRIFQCIEDDGGSVQFEVETSIHDVLGHGDHDLRPALAIQLVGIMDFRHGVDEFQPLPVCHFRVCTRSQRRGCRLA